MATGTGTDTRELVLQVDASIELAKRNLDLLAREVARQSQSMDDSLKKVDVASQRLGQSFKAPQASVGAMRAGAQQLGFQLNDVAVQFQGGARAMTIFAQQSGQIVGALSLMTGTSNKFLNFLTGPWGAGILAAGIILGGLIDQMLRQGKAIDDNVEKLKKQAQQARDTAAAEEVYGRSFEAVTAAIKKQNEEQEKRVETAAVRQEKELQDAINHVNNLKDNINLANNDIFALQAQLKTAEETLGQLPAGPGDDAYNAQLQWIERLRRKIAERNAEAVAKQAELPGAEAVARGLEAEADLAKVTAGIDSVKSATERYANATRNLFEQRKRDLITRDQYLASLQREKTLLDAAKDAAKDAGDPLAQFKAGITGAEGTGKNRMGSPAAGIGQFIPTTWIAQFDKIFSQDRGLSDAAKLALRDNKQVADAIIDNYARENKKFLEGFGATITAANLYLAHWFGPKGAQTILQAPGGTKIESLKGQPGVTQRVIDQNRIAGLTVDQIKARAAERIGGSSSAISAGQLALDKVLSDEAKKIEQQSGNYIDESSKIDEQILRSRYQLSTNAEAQAELAHRQIDTDQDQYEISINNAVVDGKFSKDKGDLLVTQREALAIQQHANVDARLRLEQSQRETESFIQTEELRRDWLQGEKDAARTVAARRSIELELLDIAFEIRRSRLLEALAAAQLAGETQKAADLQAQINALPEAKSQAQRATMKANAGPLETWMDAIPASAGEVADALEEINTRGLQGMADGIADVITGAKSMGEVFQNIGNMIVAEITKMIVKMLIMKTIMMLLKLVPSAGGIPGLGNTNAWGVSGSGDVGIYGAGGNPPVGKVSIVGDKGPELFIPRVAGRIVPNDGLGGLGGTTNIINVNGVVTTDQFWDEIDRRDMMAASAGAGMAGQRTARSRWRSLT